MFGLFAQLLSSVASFLFPLFASYKALKTSDPAQLTPWLMYWVVLSCALLVESWVYWLLFWVPFYSYFRLFFLLYLVLPQTQGARFIYEEYLHPRIAEHETAIEEFIASVHDRLREAGIAYLNHLIELLKTNVLGMPPSAESSAAAAATSEPQTAHSYTQSLLARFTLPSARWDNIQGAAAGGKGQADGGGGGGGGGGGLTADFFNVLGSAVSAAAASATAPSSSSKPPAGTNGAGSIIPDSVRAEGAAASVSFIQAQRERLRIVLSELEREEAAARQQAQGSEPPSAAAAAAAATVTATAGAAEGDSDTRKSVSELEFEKLEVPSGGEEDEGGVRKGAGLEMPAGSPGAGGWPS
ncbi:hypothetical protein VTH06DRAFT_7200 [Thermothelomyces fergusii]